MSGPAEEEKEEVGRDALVWVGAAAIAASVLVTIYVVHARREEELNAMRQGGAPKRSSTGEIIARAQKGLRGYWETFSTMMGSLLGDKNSPLVGNPSRYGERSEEEDAGFRDEQP